MNRYTVYFYDVEQKWFVYDNQTNCLVGGTGNADKAKVEKDCNRLNNYPVS